VASSFTVDHPDHHQGCLRLVERDDLGHDARRDGFERSVIHSHLPAPPPARELLAEPAQRRIRTLRALDNFGACGARKIVKIQYLHAGRTAARVRTGTGGRFHRRLPSITRRYRVLAARHFVAHHEDVCRFAVSRMRRARSI
jgi:hypothetical protein